MTANKDTIQQYMDGFNELDHAKILNCLTDDVIWEMPGFFYHVGKVAFDKEIENENFTGKPMITIFKMIEEDDVVVAEGSVTCVFKHGSMFHAVFCDVFEMNGGKIKKLITYLMEIKS